MAFDGLHLVWTTRNSRQPHDAKGNWSALHELYEQLALDGFYYELSAPLPKNAAETKLPGAIELSLNERHEVTKYLSRLVALNGDRIVGGLPVVCHAIAPTFMQLLLVPALTPCNQVVGRLKSKLASQLLLSPERKGQKHIWSSGFWYANINGEKAVAKVEQYIYQQRREWF